MKNKKLLVTLLLAGMLFVSIGTTAYAAMGPGNFYGYADNDFYYFKLQNLTKNDRYATITINAYDKNWKYKRCLSSAGSVISGSGKGKSYWRRGASLSSSPCVRGIGTIYNTVSKGSGVAASYEAKQRR